MKKNEKIIIYNYQSKPKKDSQPNRLNIYHKFFCFNSLDLLEVSNPSNTSNMKSLKNTLFPINQKSFSSNKKQININKSYKDKILNEIKFIKNKIYTETKDKNEPQETRNKSIELKKNLLLDSIYNEKKLRMNSNKNNNKKKDFFLIKYKYNNNENLKNFTTHYIKNELNKELNYLQKQYYLMDYSNINNNEEKMNNKRKYVFTDYANKNTIYNHPQLYYINNNKRNILPKIDYSIKKTWLTESIPDKTEFINKSDFIKLNKFIKMKKFAKPIFIA